MARILAAQHARRPAARRSAEQGSRDALRQPLGGQHRADPAIRRGGLLEPPTSDEGGAAGRAGSWPGGPRCSMRGSAAATSSTGTGTCSPTTSSAWPTGRGSWTAWSSMTGSAGSTGWTTPRSWPWTWSGSAPASWPSSSWLVRRVSPGTRRPRRCAITTWPTGRSSARRSAACARARATRLAGREARQLAELALRHLRAGAVTLVLVGGLPGTGKSALAGALADRLGLHRAEQRPDPQGTGGLPGGPAAHAGYGEGIYRRPGPSAPMPNCCTAPPSCSHGESVIADASFASAEQRAAAAAAAAGARPTWCSCGARPRGGWPQDGSGAGPTACRTPIPGWRRGWRRPRRHGRKPSPSTRARPSRPARPPPRLTRSSGRLKRSAPAVPRTPFGRSCPTCSRIELNPREPHRPALLRGQAKAPPAGAVP